MPHANSIALSGLPDLPLVCDQEKKNPASAVYNSSFELIRNSGTRWIAFDFQ